MKKLIILFLLLQSCNTDTSNSNTINPLVINTAFNGTTLTNVVYGSNINYFGINETLKLDVYIPPVTYTNQKFPLLVYIHGGGFLVGTKAGGDTMCRILSSNGFVSASIDYRLGRDTGLTYHACDDNYVSLNCATYRAMQDAKASLRFLVNDADKYSIDTNWIFICGQSAGGITSLSVAFLNQDSASYYLPGAIDKLGSLDSSTNTLNNSFTIKGVGNFWGALPSIGVITPTNAIPIIFTQGRFDNVVPFDTGHAFSCNNFPISYGSLSLYNKTKSLGVSTVMHEDSVGKHGVFNDTFNANNMACFFKSIISNHPQNGYYVGYITSCSTCFAKITPVTSLDMCSLGYTILKANTGTGFTYQWTRNGVNIAGSTKVRCTTTVTGNFRVIVTNANKCTKTSSSVSVIKSCN